MGLFGGNRRKALGQAIDMGSIQDQAMAEGDGTLPTMPKRPGLFGQGGKGWDVLGGTADTLLQMRGGPAVYDDGSSQRLRQLILQAQIAQQTHQANRQYDAQNPLPQTWEANNGDRYEMGPDGPRIVFKDPTPKTTWVEADDGRGGKRLIPFVNGVPMTGHSGVQPGAIIDDPRRGGQTGQPSGNFR